METLYEIVENFVVTDLVCGIPCVFIWGVYGLYCYLAGWALGIVLSYCYEAITNRRNGDNQKGE